LQNIVNRLSFHKLGLYLGVVILSVAAFLQFNRLADRYLPVLDHYRLGVQLGDPVIRSATALEGDDFGAYIQFLRQQIPENYRVMIPPLIPVRPTAHMGLMQFFLFPREIHNCGQNEVPACIERVNPASDFYILALRDFPPEELINPNRVLIPFREGTGVWSPPTNGQQDK
jgi:hypothetical protein